MQYKQNWEDMLEFKGIYLIESLVLFWSKKDNVFIIEVDLPYIKENTSDLDVLINGSYEFKKTIITFNDFKK